MRHRKFDIQGRFLRIPFDFRIPTIGKILGRMWVKDGPLFTPKAFGYGYALNVAHPASGWLVAAALLVALVLSAN